MKKILFFFAVVAALIACNPCKNVNCGNGGYCLDGQCVCTSLCHEYDAINNTCMEIDCGIGAVSCNNDTGCVCELCYSKDATGKCTIEKDCGTHGACASGSCVCETGYETDTAGKCNVEWATKFLGVYSVSETCSAVGTFIYTSTVTRNSPASIKLSNFSGFNGTNADAALTNSLNLSITNFVDGAGRTFNGTGSINGNVLTINHIITYTDNTKDTCAAVYTK